LILFIFSKLACFQVKKFIYLFKYW